MIMVDTAGFLFFPVAGICGKAPVSGTVNSGRNTASGFRVFFRQVPFESLPETAGIRWNIPRILEVPVGSARRNDRPGMLPQEESIDILKKFLLHFNHSDVKGMTIEAIEQLARMVLTENVFIYENKYYRQVIGGAMGSPFTLTLANIFMWDWEQELVENQRNSNEFYGR